MKSIYKIASKGGRFLSVGLMVFLLSFLTVGNLFIYDDDETVVTTGTANDDQSPTDDNGKRPVNSGEEKPAPAKSLADNLSDEYLNEQHLFFALYVPLLTTPLGSHAHAYDLGDDHSRLHCPPPDSILS